MLTIQDLLESSRAKQQERFGIVQSLMQQQRQPGVGTSFVGGTGDFNTTHEGPGTTGLTFGQGSQYTPMAQGLYKLIEQRFPGVGMGGIQANRNIAGTNTPSEHAYGAAVDLMASGQLGQRIYDFLMRPRIENKFDYSNVLWQVPDHYNHLHVGWLY